MGAANPPPSNGRLARKWGRLFLLCCCDKTRRGRLGGLSLFWALDNPVPSSSVILRVFENRDVYHIPNEFRFLRPTYSLDLTGTMALLHHNDERNRFVISIDVNTPFWLAGNKKWFPHSRSCALRYRASSARNQNLASIWMV